MTNRRLCFVHEGLKANGMMFSLAVVTYTLYIASFHHWSNTKKLSIHAKPWIFIRKFTGFDHNKANKPTLNWQNDCTFYEKCCTLIASSRAFFKNHSLNHHLESYLHKNCFPYLSTIALAEPPPRLVGKSAKKIFLYIAEKYTHMDSSL
jgi:hypothetical protein